MLIDNKAVVGLTSDHGETKRRNGPALRHVGPLPTSGEDSNKNYVGNYNFEEEFLLGDNKITIRQHDSIAHCYRERIEFRQESQQNEYYQIDYYETDMQPDDYDMTVSGHKLTINLHNKMDNFFNSKDNQRHESTTRLYYKDKNGEDTLISEKRIKKNVYLREGHIIESITQMNT